MEDKRGETNFKSDFGNIYPVAIKLPEADYICNGTMPLLLFLFSKKTYWVLLAPEIAVGYYFIGLPFSPLFSSELNDGIKLFTKLLFNC